MTESGAAEEAGPQQLLGGRRLVLVSNREPYVRRRSAGGRTRYERTTGGLVTALDPVMRACGGVWVAWDPKGDARGDTRHLVPGEAPQFTLRQVPLSSTEVRRYYYGFANSALWPLCHYFVDRCHFDVAEWREYEKINERFAEAVDHESQDGDLIWVHDYHFCLLPQMIRARRGRKATIAYFLHIPFPASEVFKILPWRRQILEGMLGADLVGFHTHAYASDFLDACKRILDAEVDWEAGTVKWQGRTVRVAAFPIGIDAAEFDELAGREDVLEKVGRLRGTLQAEKVILGVDRLDYSKGILERLYAVEHLFESYPQHRGRAIFVQVAVPSRTRVEEYRQLKRSIDETVGRINGRFGDGGWEPIRYRYRSLPREDLVSYYRASDVALITPLRDGMNLVAKEFVASHADGDGVLVLSEFTGAAEQMGAGALLVNPFSIEETAATLDRALEMEQKERKRRMALMREQVHDYDIGRWLGDILRSALGRPPRDGAQKARGEGRARL